MKHKTLPCSWKTTAGEENNRDRIQELVPRNAFKRLKIHDWDTVGTNNKLISQQKNLDLFRSESKWVKLSKGIQSTASMQFQFALISNLIVFNLEVGPKKKMERSFQHVAESERSASTTIQCTRRNKNLLTNFFRSADVVYEITRASRRITFLFLHTWLF